MLDNAPVGAWHDDDRRKGRWGPAGARSGSLPFFYPLSIGDPHGSSLVTAMVMVVTAVPSRGVSVPQRARLDGPCLPLRESKQCNVMSALSSLPGRRCRGGARRGSLPACLPACPGYRHTPAPVPRSVPHSFSFQRRAHRRGCRCSPSPCLCAVLQGRRQARVGGEVLLF